MATYVNDLRLKEIATGDESGTWGTSTNTNLELVAEAFSFGTEAITTNADTHTTTIADGATDPGRSIYLQYTGTLDSTCTITIGPNTVSKLWFIENATSGSQSIIIKQGSGATVTIRNGQVKAIYSDGAGSGGKMVDAFTDLNVKNLITEQEGNTTGLQLISTDADASVGPRLDLSRLSASPADDDVAGQIRFMANNDAAEETSFGFIRMLLADVSDGTEDGLLEIDSIVNGTNRSRIQMTSTETVFNQDSQDLDFRVETDTDANALFIQGSTNRVMLGFNAQIAVAGVNPHLGVVGTDNGGTTLGVVRYSADTAGPRFILGKSRNGSIATAGGTIVQSGDTVGLIQFAADDGGDVATKPVQIAAAIDGTPGSDDVPGRLVISTVPDGSASIAEALRITNAGDIGIGDSSPSTKLHVTTATQDEGVIIECTNGGTSVGPILQLDRSSATPAADDDMGRIDFSGKDSGGNTLDYVNIASRIVDPTNGSEDAGLTISTKVAGTTRSRLDFNATETVFNENSVDLDFRVETDGAANKFFVDGGNNVVVIGNNAPVSSLAVAPTFQIQGNSNANAGMSISRYTNNTSGTFINLTKSRSTSVGDNFTIVQSGDALGRISFIGADGVDMAHQSAKIGAAIDGTPGENDVPGRLTFETTPDGSSSLSEAMRIKQSGAVLINTTTDYGGKLNIARGDNNTTLALVCTDGDANDGPILDFIRDSASPGTSDDIAVINFKADDSDGNRDTYASIEVISTGVTSGSESARMDFNTLVSGSEVQRLKFSSTEAVFNDGGQNLDFRVESDGATHCLFVNAGTNKVGIKTSSPDGQLHIHTATAGTVSAGSAADELVLENSSSVGMAFLCPNDATASIHFGDPDDNNVGMIQYVHNDDSIRFTVGASEAARIISDVLCVGTTTTVADDMTARACHIASNATTTGPSLIVDDSDTSVESGSICMAVMFSNDNAFSAAKYVSFRDIGGEQGSITGDGTGSVAYNTSSDMRLKTNIQDTASQWDTIKALQVRDYEWIGNGNEETGFIAQEIHEQIPQVVYVGGEEAAKEPWAVDYGRITPQLTKALQEAMARIETLETELAKLKGGS